MFRCRTASFGLENPNRPLGPDEQHHREDRNRDRYAGSNAANAPDDQFQREPRTDQQGTGDEEVEGRPVDLLRKPHCDCRRERQDCNQAPASLTGLASFEPGW